MRHVVYDLSTDVTYACWALVGVVWLAGAALARLRGPAVERRASRHFASLAALVLGAFAVLTPASIWRPLTVGSPWPRAVGAGLLVVATTGAVWARLTLGSMWSAAVVAKHEHALRTSGPYRLTRHPIYSALLAMVAATALTQGIGRWPAIFAAVAVMIVLKIRAEERLLLDEFPAEYRRYREHVPQLVPLRRTAGRR